MGAEKGYQAGGDREHSPGKGSFCPAHETARRFCLPFTRDCRGFPCPVSSGATGHLRRDGTDKRIRKKSATCLTYPHGRTITPLLLEKAISYPLLSVVSMANSSPRIRQVRGGAPATVMSGI